MSSGPQKRSTTVHDRAALRVHPDGTRVTARELRYATQDLRGNRIATNAGGVGNVKKRKRTTISDDGTEPREEFDIETDEYQPPETQSSSADSLAGEAEDESEGEGRKRKRQKKDPRTIKRAQFYQDFDFILGGERGVGTPPVSNDSLLPSSDLLKCLHHFAANYYSEKGQLIDSTRIARQKKRAKKRADPESRSSSQSTVDPISGEESDDSDTATTSEPSVTSQTSKRKGRQGGNLVKDMYKMFDGSALVALGVFVHEHIERLVQRDWDLGLEEDPEKKELVLVDDGEGEEEG